MDAYRVGRVHRLLRQRTRRTQAEVSKVSGVGRNKISELENGNLTRVTISELDRSFAALGAAVRIWVDWRGAAIDRLIDEGHAAMTAAVGRLLRRHGWIAEFEVTFARPTERGSIDVLAWHGSSRALLVVEVKTELGSIEGTLRPLDAKVRLAPAVADERFCWRAQSTGQATGTTGRSRRSTVGGQACRRPRYNVHGANGGSQTLVGNTGRAAVRHPLSG